MLPPDNEGGGGTDTYITNIYSLVKGYGAPNIANCAMYCVPVSRDVHFLNSGTSYKMIECYSYNILKRLTSARRILFYLLTLVHAKIF